MKNVILILITSTFVLTGFNKPGDETPEQIAFNYFVSDIMKEDFKGISAIEFKGKTESDYSTLGDYTFCLTPERLGPMIKAVANGKAQAIAIRYDFTSGTAISAFTENESSSKLYLYPSVRVADRYYVFLSLKVQKQSKSTYIFEISPEGKVSRSCKVE